MSRDVPCRARGIILKAADLFDEHLDEIAGMVIAEMGKPLRMAKGEAA